MPSEYGAVMRSQPRGPPCSSLDRALGFVELARDALRMLEVDVARFGEAELARRAMQQLRAQPRFQVLNLAADGGLGQPQRACCGDEAAVLDHLGEDQRVVEIAGHGRSLVRVDWPGVGTIISKNTG